MLPLLSTMLVFPDLLHLRKSPTGSSARRAPLPPRRYALALCAAALTGTGLLALACISEAACFYGIYRLVWLERPGISHAGHTGPSAGVRTAALAVGNAPALAALCLDAGFSRLSAPAGIAGLWNGRLFAQYPLTLGTLDPAFMLPAAVLFVQFVLLASGVVLLAVRPEGQRQH